MWYYVWYKYPFFRNRSIHGDLVVLQYLPKSEWKGVSNTLKVPGTSTSSDSVHAVPTGMVVGVLSRRTCDVVASFPVSIIAYEPDVIIH